MYKRILTEMKINKLLNRGIFDKQGKATSYIEGMTVIWKVYMIPLSNTGVYLSERRNTDVKRKLYKETTIFKISRT